MKIRQILDKIDDNQLFVPAFQREYVWKKEDAKNLVSSLIKDYPTGTMLTCETNNPPELKGTYKYDVTKGTVDYSGWAAENYNAIFANERIDSSILY